MSLDHKCQVIDDPILNLKHIYLIRAAVASNNRSISKGSDRIYVRGGAGDFLGGPRIFLTLGQGGKHFFKPGQRGPTYFLQHIFLKCA